LDLQDTLSGFPIEKPWPGKIKTAEPPAPPAEIKPEPSVQEKPPEPAGPPGLDAPSHPRALPEEGEKKNNADQKAAPLAGESAAPKTSKPQAYRELDLQDTLSGFPIERPWPGKSKAAEAPEKLPPADHNPLPLREEVSPKPPDAGPSLADLEKKEIPAGENPARPDPLARFSGLEPLPDGDAVLEKPLEGPLSGALPEMEGDGEEDMEKSTAAKTQTPEDELETGADSLSEEAKGKNSIFPSEEGAEKPALDLGENPVGGTTAPAPKMSSPTAGNLYPENLLPTPPKIFSEENLPQSLRPTPQMLEDLFNQVNPIDPGDLKSN
jgi:hypothetical protein